MSEITVKSTLASPARHFFVVNPVCFESRQKMETVIARVHRFFNKSDNSLQITTPDYAVHVSRFPRDAIGAVRRFAHVVPTGAPLRVYAVGGNGTLFDCLNGVIGLPNVELGVIPYGNQNDFCRAFGKKNWRIFNSLEIQIHASSVPVDVMYCGSNYALSHCLIGMEPVAAASIEKIEAHTFLKRFRRILSPAMFLNYMCFIGAMNLSIIRQDYRLWVDDENLSGVHNLIHILNSPRFGDSEYYPFIDPADGYLDVLASGDMSVLKTFKVANKILKILKELKLDENGYQEKFSGLATYRRAKNISVATEGSLILNLDGELFYDKLVAVEIKPAAVRIIAPNLVTGAQT